jgi:hypothetical protein
MHPAALQRCLLPYCRQHNHETGLGLGFSLAGSHGYARDIDRIELPSDALYMPYAPSADLNEHFRTPERALETVTEELKRHKVPIDIRRGEAPRYSYSTCMLKHV